MRSLQSEFRIALLDPDHQVPVDLKDALGRHAGRRFDVYRNNIAVSLTEALESGFPAIVKLLGKKNFKAISGVYLRQSPPDYPMMMHYGASFPDFLRSFEPLAHLGYLGDVGDLELALRRSYHARDSEAVDGNILARVPPEQLENLRLDLAPCVEVITSPWPVHDIWAFNMIENAPKPTAVAQDVLVSRVNFDPKPDVLPQGGAVFVTALQSGASLGAASAQASAETSDFDLSAALALLLTGNAITNATI